MTGWEELKTGLRSAANKVLCRTDELAEEASLTLKKKTAEAHLAESYEKLGRAVYRVLSQKNGDESMLRTDASVSSLMDEIEKRKKEVRRLKAALLRLKDRNTDGAEHNEEEHKTEEPVEEDAEAASGNTADENA